MTRSTDPSTHALKQPRLSQNISPVCPSFVLVIASDMNLESQSIKRAKNVDLHTIENIQIQPTLLFAIFRRILRNLPPTYFLLSDLFSVRFTSAGSPQHYTSIFRSCSS